MTQPGRFKIPSRNRSFETSLDPGMRHARRLQSVVDSLRDEIRDEATTVRARRIFAEPRELFRVEIENAAMGYQRTTVLDRSLLDALRDDEIVGRRLEVRFR